MTNHPPDKKGAKIRWAGGYSGRRGHGEHVHGADGEEVEDTEYGEAMRENTTHVTNVIKEEWNRNQSR